MMLTPSAQSPFTIAHHVARSLLIVSARAVLAVLVILLLGDCHDSKSSGGREIAAVSSLRNLHSAQVQFAKAGHVDSDGDGTAEFGSIRELTATIGPRGTAAAISPPLLSGPWRRLPDRLGVFTMGGYRFCVLLPAKGNSWIVPDQVGWSNIDTQAAESRWRAWAWPERYAKGTTQTFFIDESGTILAVDDRALAGRSLPPFSSPPTNATRIEEGTNAWVP